MPGPSCGVWDLVPWPGIELWDWTPLYWERRVLATGPPGTSLIKFLSHFSSAPYPQPGKNIPKSLLDFPSPSVFFHSLLLIGVECASYFCYFTCQLTLQRCHFLETFFATGTNILVARINGSFSIWKPQYDQSSLKCVYTIELSLSALKLLLGFLVTALSLFIHLFIHSKINCVPFHLWSCDRTQNTRTPVLMKSVLYWGR